MEALSDKVVVSRKINKCSACLRVMPIGTKIRKVVVVYNGLQTWKECPTCAELLNKYSNRFDDGFGIFEYGCVDNVLDIGQTPEMLLAELSK